MNKCIQVFESKPESYTNDFFSNSAALQNKAYILFLPITKALILLTITKIAFQYVVRIF